MTPDVTALFMINSLFKLNKTAQVEWENGVTALHIPFKVSIKEKFTLGKKCLYSELSWSVFSCIRTEYGEISRMRENADQINSEYGHFSRSVIFIHFLFQQNLDNFFNHWQRGK